MWRTKLSYAQLWSMLLLHGLHIPKKILNCLNLCKIGQHAGSVAVAGVHPLIHGLYLQVIAALSLIFLLLNQDVSTFLFLSSIIFTTIIHPSSSIVTVNLMQFHLPCRSHHLSISPPQSTINSHHYSLVLFFCGIL